MRSRSIVERVDAISAPANEFTALCGKIAAAHSCRPATVLDELEQIVRDRPSQVTTGGALAIAGALRIGDWYAHAERVIDLIEAMAEKNPHLKRWHMIIVALKRVAMGYDAGVRLKVAEKAATLLETFGHDARKALRLIETQFGDLPPAHGRARPVFSHTHG